MQERQDKLKGGASGTDKNNTVGGVLGRYVQHNTKQQNQGQNDSLMRLQRPGME